MTKKKGISTGIGAVSYAILGANIPLWRVREGVNHSDAMVAVTVSVGLAAMTFVYGYEIIALLLGLDTRLLLLLGLVLPLSIALILVGALERPRFLFQPDEGTDTLGSQRPAVGISLVVVGFGVIAATLFHAVVLQPLASPLLVYWLCVIGIIVILSGATVLWGPLARPWCPGGYSKQPRKVGCPGSVCELLPEFSESISSRLTACPKCSRTSSGTKKLIGCKGVVTQRGSSRCQW